MSKANITPLVQNPQESIDRLQTLSIDLQVKNSNVADNSLYYLNQTAIQNFILSFQEQQREELKKSEERTKSKENDNQKESSQEIATKGKLAQIELNFLNHLQQINGYSNQKVSLSQKEIRTRNENHKERLSSLREEVKNRIEEYSNEISTVAPYRNKMEEGETSFPPTFKAQEIYKYSSVGIKNFTKDLIEESKADLANAGMTLGEDIKYVISCFGSLARDEASPYSDLEFGVLLEDNLSEEKLEETKQYFRNLTDLLNIKVINLGETTATIQDIKEVKDLALKLPTKNGFSFDGNTLGGCKTPLGNKRAIVKRIEEINQDKVRDIEFINSNNSLSQKQKDERIVEVSETINRRISKLQEDEYELIMTPSQMAQFHNEDWYRRDRHLSTVLYTTDLLQANSLGDGKELLESYKIETNKILNRDIAIDELSEAEQQNIPLSPRSLVSSLKSVVIDNKKLEKLTTLREKRAFNLLDESIGKFEPKAGRDQDKGKSFSPKYDFYRPATMMIDHLSYLYGIGNRDGEESVWDRFDRLFVGNSQNLPPLPLATIDDHNIEGINNLRWMIDRTLQIRLKNYMAKDNQNEDMILLDEYEERERKELKEKGLGIYEGEIFEIYYVMIMFFVHVNNFSDSKGKNTKEFSKKLNFDDNSFIKAKIHDLFLHYEKSIKCHEQFIEKYKTNGQEKHPNVAASLNNLGISYGAQGKYKIQIELLNQSLGINQEVFGEKHPAVAANLDGLGNAYGSLGDYNRRIELLNQSLEIRKEVLGDKHLSVAMSLHNLGNAYGNLEDHTKAIELYNQALEINKEILGEKHPDIAASVHGLGNAYGDLGDYKKQIGLLNQALEIRKEVLGNKHPNVAASVYELGNAYGSLGDHNKQIELLNQALKIRKKMFGEKHPDVVASLNSLGSCYGSLGDYNRKIELLNQALKINKKMFGEKHPDVAVSLNNLGNAYGSFGDHNKQIELLNQSLEIKKEVFGEKHSDVAASLSNLGNAYGSLGDHNKQIELYNQALEINKKTFGESHPAVAGSLNNLGSAYGSLGNNRRQRELLNQSLEIRKEVFGEKHPNVAASLNNLGIAYGAVGDHNREIALLNQSLEIRQEFFGDKHPDVAVGLNNLGIAYGAVGDHNKKIALLNKSLEIKKEIFGEKHPDVAGNLNNLGTAYEALGNHRRSIELYNQALEINKETYTEKHPDVARSLYNLGVAYVRLEDYPKAFEFAQRSLTMFSEFYDKNHPTIKTITQACSALESLLIKTQQSSNQPATFVQNPKINDQNDRSYMI